MIIVCTSTALGGLELNIAKLAMWLTQKGYPVTFLCPKSSMLFERAQQWGVRTKAFSKKFKYMDVLAAFKLGKICAELKENKVLVTYNTDIDLAFVTKVLFLPTLQVSYLQQMEVGIAKKDLFHTLKYRQLHAWLSPLPWLIKQVEQRTRMPMERVKQVPLCIEVEKFAQCNLSTEELRKKFDLPLKGSIVATVGRIDPQKGTHTSIEAFNKICTRYPNLYLMIMGEATLNDKASLEYQDKLHALAQASCAKERILFRPFSNDVHQALKACEYFVMPSLKETFGMVTIEAMASGALVIGANTGGTKDLLENGVLGAIFEVQNAQSLADKLVEVLENPEQYQQVRQKAQQVVAKKYSHHTMCELVIEAMNLSSANQ